MKTRLRAMLDGMQIRDTAPAMPQRTPTRRRRMGTAKRRYNLAAERRLLLRAAFDVVRYQDRRMATNLARALGGLEPIKAEILQQAREIVEAAARLRASEGEGK